MRALNRIRGFGTAFRSSQRHRGDLVGWLRRRPQIVAATGIYETALLFSNALEPKLKELAELKAAGLISCEFCLDIGSALAHDSGVSKQQIRDLPRYRDSSAYSELEKLVIGYAEAMTLTPAVGENLTQLREELSRYLSRRQIAELAMTVAWENQRGRLNQALGVRPMGMSDGQACALPEVP